MEVSSKQTASFLFLLLTLGCSVTKRQQAGTIIPQEFRYETKFRTRKSIIILPFEIDGISKNFLFDTGADFSLIQRDSTVGKTSSYAGASKRKMRLGTEYIESMKIGDVEFANTIALNGDMDGLKQKISNFGGLIGQPIISKANWLINYPDSTITLSNGNLADTTLRSIEIKREDGAPYTFITVNGNEYKVIIDLGSSSELNLPEGSRLAKELLDQYNFIDNSRDRYTLGGTQIIKEKVGIVPSVKLANMEFANVNTTINISSQPRIGIAFFKDCVVYIDNTNGGYKIKK